MIFALFSYGTLRSDLVQMSLFGCIFPCEPAILHDHKVLVDDDGFYFLVPENGTAVAGHVLLLDERALNIADQWEEVPVYDRVLKWVGTSEGTREVWVYFKQWTGSGMPVSMASLGTGLSEKELKGTLKGFKMLRDECDVLCDVYAVMLSGHDPDSIDVIKRFEAEKPHWLDYEYDGYPVKHMVEIVHGDKRSDIILSIPMSIVSPWRFEAALTALRLKLETLFEPLATLSYDTSEIHYFSAVSMQALGQTWHEADFNEIYSIRRLKALSYLKALK